VEENADEKSSVIFQKHRHSALSKKENNICSVIRMNTALLLDTLHGKVTSRPPVWYMRQAGRVLPSYVALKERYSFWQMMQRPDIAAQVTLLPVHNLGVDAAILFSDILVIPYAMGLGLDFTDNGPVFETPLHCRENPVGDLHPDPAKLQYIYNVIDEVIRTRPENTPLIGFCGAPLTVLLYMLQGFSRKSEFPEAIKYMYQHPQTTQKLIAAITELSIEYAREQINHGVDVFQLFETHAGLVPFEIYNDLVMPSVRKIARAVREKHTPFIFFPKGIGSGIQYMTPDVCDFLSVDWQTPLATAREMVHPEVGLQGNIDPRMLYSNQKDLEQYLNAYLEFGKKNTNWIFNLGHGFVHDIPVENIKWMTDWVKNTDWHR
jgi:uroporphyrinogen decarboxylase